MNITGIELLHTLWMIPIALAFAARDAWLITYRKKSPNHKWLFGFRALTAIAIGATVYRDCPGELWYLAFIFTFAEAFLFWLVFESAINILRFMDFGAWDYRGNTAEQDKFLNENHSIGELLTPDIMFSIKLFMFGMLLFTYGIIIG
jgi:hypothetical protein